MSPYRHPRLIELQYLRILRYRDCLNRKYGPEYWQPDVFVDLNFPRIPSMASIPERLPAFVELCNHIREQRYSLVYLDLEEGNSSQSHGFAFVRMTFRNCGAKVLNAFHDDEGAFKAALRDRYGDVASASQINTPSDFVGFFPGLAADITAAAVRPDLSHSGDKEEALPSLVESRLRDLHQISPYTGAGFRPFIEERLRAEWCRSATEREEKLRVERRKHETLYRLGPNHAGVLLDENRDSRSEEELALAEIRLNDELRFRKIISGRFISYERVVAQCRVFADARTKGAITFFVYDKKAEKRKKDLNLSAVQFVIPDRWKHGLAGLWMREFEARTDSRDL
jgi:hypothetical protein